MNQILFYILICLGSSLGCYLYFRPKLKATQKIDEQAQQENERLQKEIEQQREQLNINKEALKENEKTAKFWADYLLKQQNDAQEAAEKYKKQCFKVAENELENKLKEIEQIKEETFNAFIKEYNQAAEDIISEYKLQVIEEQDKIHDLKMILDHEQSKVDCAVEENKRIFEAANQKDFYRLCLTDEDISEIMKLREITPYLRNPEPSNKVIWKVYYEKPYTDLIGRVVGAGIHTGIYKITNIENQMCYVGQAVNIADRWKTHIKRGIGAETPINNKLYPAMKQFGVENFTFEIIEECERSRLNEQEDYWQNFYKAKEFGYSIK